MISIPIKDVQSAILSFDQDIQLLTSKLKGRIRAISREGLNDRQKKYLKLLYQRADILVTADPQLLDQLAGEFDRTLSSKKIGKGMQRFAKSIQQALRYEDLRYTFYPSYFRKIGIKACVYCNSQLTVSVDKQRPRRKSSSKVSARFQVDHFRPKSFYPCFSISLFNLYPVCGSCNNGKRELTVPFYLYQQDDQCLSSPFLFELDPYTRADFILNRDASRLKHVFKEPAVQGSNRLNDVFDIQGIYDTQLDIVEELLLKADVYTPDYKSILVKTFPKIFTPELIDRLIIGNYSTPADIHKRPLSKFTMDIAKQIGLIP